MEPTTAEIVEYTVFEYEDVTSNFRNKKKLRKGSQSCDVKVVDLSNGKVLTKHQSKRRSTARKYKSDEGYTVEEPDSD